MSGQGGIHQLPSKTFTGRNEGGRELSGGAASVELAGVVEATRENCEVYSEALGVKVTPHPILGLPVI